jgi:hypothetical protein
MAVYAAVFGDSHFCFLSGTTIASIAVAIIAWQPGVHRATLAACVLAPLALFVVRQIVEFFFELFSPNGPRWCDGDPLPYGKPVASLVDVLYPLGWCAALLLLVGAVMMVQWARRRARTE